MGDFIRIFFWLYIHIYGLGPLNCLFSPVSACTGTWATCARERCMCCSCYTRAGLFKSKRFLFWNPLKRIHLKRWNHLKSFVENATGTTIFFFPGANCHPNIKIYMERIFPWLLENCGSLSGKMSAWAG